MLLENEVFFDAIVGQRKILKEMAESIDSGRIPHAQLFVGKEGIGLLQIAISVAKMILTKGVNVDNLDVNRLNLRVNNISHPDLHFVFPVSSNDEVKSHPVSINFIEQWKKFLELHPYGSLLDWYSVMGIQNKQGQISVNEAQEIVKKLSLKSYEGGYKIMIIWNAEKMNTAAANKILKILEEPPLHTVFILTCENQEDLLSTIVSRCQVTAFKNPSYEEICNHLIKQSFDEAQIKRAAYLCQGDVNKAYKELLKGNDDGTDFEGWFVKWVRTAFKAKGNASAVLELIKWGEDIASLGREHQKEFLHYCIDFFRQAFLFNYTQDKMIYLDEALKNFDLSKFAPFVNQANINDIFAELSKAIYHIERNGNSKIILTDLSIKLTRLIHKK